MAWGSEVEQFILNVLSGYGLAGVVILALGWAVLQQWRSANKINELRLAERDILIKALENNTAATKANALAIGSRNQVTEELGMSLEKQALVFELFMQKVDIHDGNLSGKIQEFKQVIDALAEANRTNTGILTLIRDKVDPVQPRRR